MTSEDRADIDYMRRTLTKLEFALMTPADPIEAQLFASAIEAASGRILDRIQYGELMPVRAEHARQNAAY